MARKPNYDFEKRRKEAERKAKKDAKLEAKKERKRLGIEEPEEIVDLSDYGIERSDDAPEDGTSGGDAGNDVPGRPA
jgi:hypothetical protein